MHTLPLGSPKRSGSEFAPALPNESERSDCSSPGESPMDDCFVSVGPKCVFIGETLKGPRRRTGARKEF